ncbi:MAG TPA: ABC transporter ATP-binding protein [Nocardioides sp.]|uniref:ABC transporter ATP-binding protein n=1 Tax=Nocardioides sp. TaxID=35761 RepID=UPI002E354852|nr:ABC transporter ATP-binding protein [Nocardioides sp.]HEX3930028.1 ABC transporter ATP-binding protein [Nocardioides sp.]
MTPLLSVRDLRIAYSGSDVVHGVDVDVPDGPYGVGLIGESGSGKTTIARALLRLHPVSGGSVSFDGQDVLGLRGAALSEYRRSAQIVFQDGDGALDPRMSVYSTVAEPFAVHRTVPRSERRARVALLLDEVGLPADVSTRYPHQLSGGQRQRVVIARALALEPRLLVLDEPTSALDVTVQERVLRLIERLRAERGLAYLLISHNLAVVDRLCESSVVLYRGVVMERGSTVTLLSRPLHPYTRALRAAVPEIGVTRPPLTHVATGASTPGAPTGCVYADRCPLAVEICRTETPALRELDGRDVACHRAEEATAAGS